MYKVKNVSKDVRKFYDQKKGRYIMLNPGESAFTVNAIDSTDMLKVEEVKESVKQVSIKKEVDNK